MNLLSEAKIKELLQREDIRPDKNQGQNFLTSRIALSELIEAAELTVTDHVLEVGPGLGTITKALAQTVKRVTAVERDSRLVKILKETCGSKNVKIVNQDFLNFDLSEFENFKVVSSLPFNSGVAIIRKILEQTSPELMVVTVQKEVAEKIIAEPPNMTLVAVAVQLYGDPQQVGSISKREFFPRPEVDSSILKITDIVPPNHQLRQERFNNKLFKIIKAGFAHSRKKLINSLDLELNLSKEELKRSLKQVGIEPERRAETLTVEEWIEFSKSITTFNT